MNIRDYLSKGFRYATIGGIGALINWSTLYLLVQYTHIWYIYGAMIASLITVITNFNMMILWKVVKVK